MWYALVQFYKWRIYAFLVSKYESDVTIELMRWYRNDEPEFSLEMRLMIDSLAENVNATVSTKWHHSLTTRGPA